MKEETMPKAVMYEGYGGIDVLQVVEWIVPSPVRDRSS